MKTTKQIRENYNRNRSSSDALEQLVFDGLLDESKLTLVRRALQEGRNTLTNAEKSALNECISAVVSEKQEVELLDEAKKKNYLTKFDPRFGSKFPTDKVIPQILILKRKAIRVFPDNAKVALYYADSIDKYISIPFGEIGVGSVNEEKIEEVAVEKYQSKKNIVEKVRQLKESNEEFADTDIKSRFSQRLDEARQEQIDEVAPLVAGAAALAARAAPYIARGAAALGKKGLSKGKELLDKYKKSRKAKKAEKEGYKQEKQKIRDEKKASREQAKRDRLDPKKRKERGQQKAREKAEKGGKLKRFAAGALGLAAGAAAGGAGGGSSGGGMSGSGRRREYQPGERVQGRSSWEGRRGIYDPVNQAAMNSVEYRKMLRQNPQYQQNPIQESVLNQLNSIEESVNISFEDGSITVTPTMAKNILKVYDSVNEDNKNKIEQMINESAESLKKFINFASRY